MRASKWVSLSFARDKNKHAELCWPNFPEAGAIRDATTGRTLEYLAQLGQRVLRLFFCLEGMFSCHGRMFQNVPECSGYYKDHLEDPSI